ncbi:DUF4412 domain-containing protein [Polaribacter sp.]|uniref:DUF4412 domain-containing protein n=1 Tax=Polaribacter sp. TaxID=1920175 RepID=UPI003EF2910D
MKTIKLIVTIITLLFVTQGQAQFWKKIVKKAEKVAEEVVERKVEEKAAKETEKGFDSVFNNQGNLFKRKKVKVAENYTFTHQYVMEITSDKNTTDITYYLTNENEYMGSSFTAGKDQKFITVMDLPNSAIHTFMDLGGHKTMNSLKIDLEDVGNMQTNTSDFTIVATGQTKEIIGYQCEEFQVTGPQLSGKVWVTNQADISFQKAFTQLKSKKMKLTKGMDQSWVSMVDGLTLEMNMIDYSRKKNKSVKMICTSLSKSDFSINTSQYQK